MNPYGSLRLQYLAKGWKLGLGLNAIASATYNEVTTKYELNNVTTVSGTPAPATDSVATRNYGYTSLAKTDNITSTIELPIGLVLNMLENLPIRFGMKHSIIHTQTSSRTEVTARTPDTTRTVYGDGHITNSVPAAVTGTDERNISNYSVSHSNSWYYGLSWLPYKDVQIDVTGFYYPMSLANYQLSFNLYF
jgi:hypothetical protein